MDVFLNDGSRGPVGIVFLGGSLVEILTPEGVTHVSLAQQASRTWVSEAVQRGIYAVDGPATAVAVKRELGVKATILGDVELARQLAGPEAFPDLLAPASTPYVAVAEALQSRLRDLGLLHLYRVELLVAAWLGGMSAEGYWRGEEVCHPQWVTLHAGGSGRIVSRQPSLSNLRRSDRRAFLADAGFQWVEVGWPDGDLAVLADLTRDPVLQAALKTDDPYRALFPESPRPDLCWNELVVHGLNMARLASEVAADVVAFSRRAVRWKDWWSDTVAAADRSGYVVTEGGRRIRCEAVKAPAYAVIESAAERFKLWLALVQREVEVRSEGECAGFRSLIPLYTRIFYQIHHHVPLDRHVDRIAHPVGWAGQLGLRVEVGVGPTWGDIQRIPLDMIRIAGDLLERAEPVWCPRCGGLARDLETLLQHRCEPPSVEVAHV